MSNIEIDKPFSSNAYFGWGWKGFGFGQLSFSLNPKDNKIYIMNECMGRERVRELLHAYADYIADNGILTDDPINGGQK